MANDELSVSVTSRPTVIIGGQKLPLLSANLAHFKMREALGGMSSLELSVYDLLSFPDGSGFGATDTSPLRLGAEIKIYMGDTREPQEIFDGVVTAIEAEAGPHSTRLFTLLAEDRLFKLRRKRRSRTFDDLSPADVIRTIAQDHGLRAEVGDNLDSPVTTWAQINESDLAFLRRMLAMIDADAQLVAAATLQAVAIAKETKATVPLALGDTLLRIRVTADLAEQATATRVGSFDAATGEGVSEEATTGRLGPGRGRDGASFLRDLAGEVREHIGHLRPMTQDHCQLLARAAFGSRARSFIRADGTAQGNGAIRVGSWLNISGINPFFINTYNVVEAVHRFDIENGYLTDFMAECAFLGDGA